MYISHIPGLAVRGGGGGTHDQVIMERSYKLVVERLSAYKKCHAYYYGTISQS